MDPPPTMSPDVLIQDEPSYLDTVRAGAFDNGKMWTFDAPPRSYLAETYGFEPDEAWFSSARLGALRIPSCSASFVSPNGLVMTNHHCGRDFVTQVAEEGENLLDDGFYASSLGEERAVEDFEADQLIEIIDVTAEIQSAVDAESDADARSEVREELTESVAERLAEERGGEDAGIEVEIVSLYNGGLYSAYVFRRYTNVKLVMAPELQMGYFGGDPDNFTYPRYSLDMTFFRVYDDNDEPLSTPDYFRWSDEGVSEGDLVFIIGNPGATTRLQTVAELEYRRDVEMPALRAFLDSRISVLEEYLEGREDEPGIDEVRNSVFGLLNSQKAYGGMHEGLMDPYVLARRADTERAFREAVEGDPTLAAEYGPVFEEMAGFQERKRTVADEFRAFAALFSPEYESTVLLRALSAFQYLVGQQQGAPQEELDEFLDQLREQANRPRELDEALLQARFQDFVDAFGMDDPTTQAVLGGRSPEGAAANLLDTSALADSAQAVEAVENGTLNPMSEPAFAFIQNMLGRFGPFQGLMIELGAAEEEASAKLGRARYEVYGTDVPPDATFSLRIADGVVKGYDYNGTKAPVYTTLFGLYDRHYSNPGSEEWDLPSKWQTAQNVLDLSTPMNFVSTADIIGGNSGSAVLNRDLEVVGLVFDGNIESLPGDYIYLPTVNRAVSVDGRVIVEVLDNVYDADRLVVEITSGQLVATEAEADRIR